MESLCTPRNAAVLCATRGQEAVLQEVEAEDEDYYKLSKSVPTRARHIYRQADIIGRY